MVRPAPSLAIESRGRLFMAADLAMLPTHLPSGDVDFELDRGRLVVFVPSGLAHAAVHSRLMRAICSEAERTGGGEAFGRVGIVLSRDPDTVFAPDISFITAAKLPVRESPEGYLETIPDLVIEIRDRNDTTAELDKKVAVYIAAGVRIVWVADPAKKIIVLHQSGRAPRACGESNTLILDEVNPDLKLKVAGVFPS